LKLVFPSIDETRQGRVAHGDRCVILMVEDRDYRLQAGLILDVKEARSLGRRLIQQADAAATPIQPRPPHTP
jgi:hypothetical protein